MDDLPKREQAEREIGQIASQQICRFEEGGVTGREMILACRSILDLWIDSGRSSLDDEVVGVLGIESQCSHVMLRQGQRQPRFTPEYDDEDAEIVSLGNFFREGFAREMRELAQRFGDRSHERS